MKFPFYINQAQYDFLKEALDFEDKVFLGLQKHIPIKISENADLDRLMAFFDSINHFKFMLLGIDSANGLAEKREIIPECYFVDSVQCVAVFSIKYNPIIPIPNGIFIQLFAQEISKIQAEYDIIKTWYNFQS